MGHGSDLQFKVENLTRVEGEGSLRIRVRDGVVEEAQLAIFEAPRYFEALVAGRTPDEVIDIVARICGICPVAYQMSAVHAFEDLFGVAVHPQVRALRRLLYCGEWIESHALHIYLLHAPDFLGYPSAVELARDHRRARQRRPPAQEGRQPPPVRARRPADPPGERPRRRLLAGCRAGASSWPCARASRRRSGSPRRPSTSRPASRRRPSSSASRGSSSLKHRERIPAQRRADRLDRRA